jgi:hypothetical protein
MAIAGLVALLFAIAAGTVCVLLIAGISSAQNALVRFFAWLFGRDGTDH